MFRTSIIATLLLFSSLVSWSQTDDIEEEKPEKEKVKKEFVFKPTVGVGVGMLTYYGDISRQNTGNNPIVNRLGYDLRITQSLNSFLDLHFNMLLGKLGANERSLDRNLNFESSITAGGFSVSYNFDHLLNEGRKIDPFVSVGFETVEFLSKTDLFDAFGNPYYYWSDGSIRNLPENAVNAENAQRIQRDYEYESDIRELNLDGFGDYEERTFGIPVGAGVNLHVSNKFKFKLGTTMHWTFSDYIDGVTENSLGSRKGDKKNDRFLFTSLSFTYNLSGDEEKFKDINDPVDEDNFDDGDLDGDGVIDFVDACPNTPPDVEVDAKGCPPDEDGDGVPDYKDREPGTVAGAPVDTNGVALTDDAIALIYLEYTDETGQYAQYKNRTYAVDEPAQTLRKKKTYKVQVGPDDTREISEAEANAMLNDPDIKTIENEKGDVLFVTSEEFETQEEAEEAAQEIAEETGEPVNVVETSPETGKVAGAPKAVINPIFPHATLDREIDKRSVSKIDSDVQEYGSQTIYRVQLGAFTRKLSSDIFEDVPNLFVVTTDDGLTRYYSGSFTNYGEAATRKIDLISEGFEGAYVVPFKNGSKITLSEAGATPAKNVAPRSPSSSQNNVDRSKVKFKVQVGSYSSIVPTDVLEKFMALGKVDQKRGSDGNTRYMVGEFDDYQSAIQYKDQLVNDGIDGAFVVGQFDGKIIDAKEALELIK